MTLAAGGGAAVRVVHRGGSREHGDEQEGRKSRRDPRYPRPNLPCIHAHTRWWFFINLWAPRGDGNYSRSRRTIRFSRCFSMVLLFEG